MRNANRFSHTAGLIIGMKFAEKQLFRRKLDSKRNFGEK